LFNWLRQLIARDKAKQPQLKNQLTKSHESSLPTIGRDRGELIEASTFQDFLDLRNYQLSNIPVLCCDGI
jgi:hypothetical protein